MHSYSERRAEQLREWAKTYPARLGELRELDALYLFGTIGMEAVMRPDGTVLVAIDEHWGEANAPEPTWRVASSTERTLSIKVASERWPEFAELLPQRPPGALDCQVCHGTGGITNSVYCGDCGAMGWVAEQAI